MHLFNIKENKNFDLKIYLCILLVLMIFYYFICFISNGKYLDSVFLTDKADTYMDYFNSISNARFNPYEMSTNQPALVKIIFKFLLSIVPAAERMGDGFDFRSLKSAQIGFILYNIFINIIFVKIVHSNSKLSNNLFTQAILIIFISAPVMFTFERGNIVWLALVLTLYFTSYYHSENKLKKELSYIALALAASIKIYPAIFGLLLLKEKKWKEAIRTLFYGIACFFIPFFYFDGLKSLKAMGVSLFRMSEIAESRGHTGLGLNVSFLNICKTFFAIFNVEFNNTVYLIAKTIVIVLLLLSFIIIKNKWKNVLSLVLLAILLPGTNYYYAMTFLIIPFFEMLNTDYQMDYEEKTKNTKSYKYWVLFGIALVPWILGNIPKLSTDVKFIVSYGMLLNLLTLLWMLASLIIDTINIVLKGKFKKKIYYISNTLLILGSIVTIVFTFI